MIERKQQRKDVLRQLRGGNFHPDNRHVKDKIRQQFQILRDVVCHCTSIEASGVCSKFRDGVRDLHQSAEMTWNVPFDFTSTPKPAYMLSEEITSAGFFFNFCI